MATLELASNKRGLVKKTEEYFNAIRTNIQLSGSELKVIGITSAESNEGKSTTAASLAIAYARSGYKTILLELIFVIQSCLVSLSPRQKLRV